MNDLRAFMNGNADPTPSVKFAPSKRFRMDNGDPIEWEIQPITAAQDDIIRKSCTKRVPVPGKKGAFVSELDSGMYGKKQAVACTVFPPLTNAELQNSYGVMGAEELLTVMLLPGEYYDYLTKVQEVCGFNVSIGEQVEEAKN